MPRARNGYTLPLPLPLDTVVKDVNENKWKLGPPIGKGGFGEIYSAKDASSSNSSFPYVVKIEPHANSPLFVEMHFYMKNGKEDLIKEFQLEKKLSSLGMPKYIGSGVHDHNGTEYRFVVMDKFGSDIWKLFIENEYRFSPDIVFKLGVQILDVLEYIHSKGYIHADIKATNILLGSDAESNAQVYLVDFGLCSEYGTNEKPDPKKAHNGTIEYVSRDGHLGIETRRGDLECLGYNLVQWLGCSLPWEIDLTNPTIVQQSKIDNIKNLTKFFKNCFGDEKPPAAIIEYMKYVTTLKIETEPDYVKLRKILIKGLEAAGGSMKSPFNFPISQSSLSKRKMTTKSPSPKKKTKAVTKKEKPTKDSKSAKDDARKEKVSKGNESTKDVPKEIIAEKDQNADDDSGEDTEEKRKIKIRSFEKEQVKSVAQPRALRTRKDINYNEEALIQNSTRHNITSRKQT